MIGLGKVPSEFGGSILCALSTVQLRFRPRAKESSVMSLQDQVKSLIIPLLMHIQNFHCYYKFRFIIVSLLISAQICSSAFMSGLIKNECPPSPLQSAQ